MKSRWFFRYPFHILGLAVVELDWDYSNSDKTTDNIIGERRKLRFVQLLRESEGNLRAEK